MENILFKLKENRSGTKELLGGKGFYIKSLADGGAPVPNACTLSTDLWKNYNKNLKKTIEQLKDKYIPEIVAYLKEEGVNKEDKIFPLVSVRSGSSVSMPGMMDTILNLGINQSNVEDYANKYGKEFAYDCYTRFLSMFGEIALEIDKVKLEEARINKGKVYKSSKEINKVYDTIYKEFGFSLPDENIENHLLTAIVSVLKSWNNERAKIYREINKIPDDIGTAVTIQKMVFGNRNENSATGVLFTRDPSTGKSAITGEFMVKAQGEDVVSGSRTPSDLADMYAWNSDVYSQLKKIVQDLETKYNEVQDVEFTVDDGQLYILQTRTAKRTPYAALKIAIDYYKEGLIDAKEVFSRLSLKEYLALNNKQVDPSYRVAPDGVGLAASNGVLLGKVIFDLRGIDLVEGPKILLAHETTPDDMPILKNVDGVITSVGGITSHAAVVARSLNKCAIVGSEDLRVIKDSDRTKIFAKIGDKIIREGDQITMEAETGRIWIGNDVPIIQGNDNVLLLKLEDIVFEAFPLTRVTSSVDDIISDYFTIYATYMLDGKDEEFIEKELFDAIDIMSNGEKLEVGGIIDLTGKLDFMQEKLNNAIPFVDHIAKANFEIKAEILLSIQIDKDKFKVYLGKYHEDWHTKFEEFGFKLEEPKNFNFMLNKKEYKLKNDNTINIVNNITLEQIEEMTIAEKRLAISGKNVLLSILKP